MSAPAVNPPSGGHIPSPPSKPTLLVVDDEDGPRQSIWFVFKDEYNILLAESGPVALDLARANAINVAILDIRMPGMSGLEVLQGLKELSPATEVLMLTAYESSDSTRQALRLGARDYLDKPFDIPTLRAAVRKAFERNSVTLEMLDNSHRMAELREEIHRRRLSEEEARKRGDIYASIIHDINGPLTIISGFIDTINKGIGDAPSLEGNQLDLVRDRLNRITRQVTSCVEISRRYLSFMNSRGLESSQVSVAQVLRDVEDLFQYRKVSPRSKLTITPPSPDLIARINGIDLLQIVINLSINALDASPQGVMVQVQARPLSSPVEASRMSDGPGHRFRKGENFANRLPLIALSITDNGSGIPSEVLARLFEPYFTTKPSGQGTGLGLSIVQRLVEHAKGAVEVETSPGSGTTFTVIIPGAVSDQQ